MSSGRTSEHEGKTWNRCKRCGLLELWEGGMFSRAALAGSAGTEQTRECSCCCGPLTADGKCANMTETGCALVGVRGE